MPLPKSPLLAADGILLEKRCVLLVKRKIHPFFGFWVIPGGHIEYGETAENAVKRELKEELGVTVKIKKLIGVYSNPKRDPRYHIISIVYLVEKNKGKIKLNEEASEFKFFYLKNLPKKIGFDHRKALNDLKIILNQ